jgi:glutamate/tyrosine decarboxylase-like PLP-dependent enzyme
LQNETISTYIESLALDLVLDLLSIPTSHFKGRTISTGATTSNILGLALGRQFCISQIKGTNYSVAESGFGGVEIEVLSVGAHASIRKAASIVGIGRANVREIGDTNEENGIISFDLEELERTLKEAKEKKRGVIVCPSYGEVNTVSSRSS